eukprot:CAMPEP_0119334322 /NCGR_PEP_ID=MMETSP1333-20130426/87028_1 /TAXON_ID=418940 /ORGANISM="Scyphosphaera apsteinii, Strain RCC1455" /LENGTH=392 /DNA_ID=CAMNT_0007344589 /DNA_START=194 /DNA_END=1372 /DNA_ORIENTATION=+
MPTNSRPAFVRLALSSIASTTYPHHLISTVVVVDDSLPAQRAPPLRYELENVTKYVLLERPTAIGEKRNIAVAHCTGSIILHHDDDDSFGPTRIEQQVLPIARGEAELTLLEHRLTYFMDVDQLWEASTSWGPHFGTLAYRRSLVSAARGVFFPNTSQGEDYGFAQRAVVQGAKLRVVKSEAASSTRPIFVCVRHGSNTWEWSQPMLQDKIRDHGRLVDTSRLDPALLNFATRMRSSGVLEALAATRKAHPAPNRFMDDDIDPNFFNQLFESHGGTRGPAEFNATLEQHRMLPPATASHLSYFDTRASFEKCVAACTGANCLQQCQLLWLVSHHKHSSSRLLGEVPTHPTGDDAYAAEVARLLLRRRRWRKKLAAGTRSWVRSPNRAASVLE